MISNLLQCTLITVIAWPLFLKASSPLSCLEESRVFISLKQFISCVLLCFFLALRVILFKLNCVWICYINRQLYRVSCQELFATWWPPLIYVIISCFSDLEINRGAWILHYTELSDFPMTFISDPPKLKAVS